MSQQDTVKRRRNLFNTDPYNSLSRLHKKNRKGEVHRPQPPTESTVAVPHRTFAGNAIRRVPSTTSSTSSDSILKDYLNSHSSYNSGHSASGGELLSLNPPTPQFSFLNQSKSSGVSSLTSLKPHQRSDPFGAYFARKSSGDVIKIDDCDVSFGRLKLMHAKLTVSRTGWQVQTQSGDRVPGFHVNERQFDRACLLDLPTTKQIYITLVKARLFKSPADPTPLCADHIHINMFPEDPEVCKLMAKLENKRNTIKEDEPMMQRKVRHNCEPPIEYEEFREAVGMRFEDVDRDSPEYNNLRGLSNGAHISPLNPTTNIDNPPSKPALSDTQPDGRRKSARIKTMVQYGGALDSMAYSREEKQKHLEQFGPSDLSYKFDDGRTQTIGPSDVERLEEGEFLNDTVINFFLKYCHQRLRKRSLVEADAIHIFNTYFYERLSRDMTADFDAVYNQLKKWTAKVDLFSKKCIIIPVNASLHWYLIVIYNLPALLTEAKSERADREDDNEGEIVQMTPRLFVLDSLKSQSSFYTDSLNLVKLFIQHEAKAKLGLTVDAERIKTKLAHTPQQTNFCDCGVYMIHYVQKFLQRPDEVARLMASRSLKNRRPLNKLWMGTSISKKRDQLRDLLCDLKHRPNEPRPYFMLPDDAVDELEKNQPSEPMQMDIDPTPSMDTANPL